MYGLIKQCAAFRVLFSRATIDWTAELPALHRCLINDKSARSQCGQPLIFWRPQSYVGRCVCLSACVCVYALFAQARVGMIQVLLIEDTSGTGCGTFISSLLFAACWAPTFLACVLHRCRSRSLRPSCHHLFLRSLSLSGLYQHLH